MKQFLLIISTLFVISCGQQTISYKEISKRTDASKDIAKKFGKQLKTELQDAMKSGGPLEAITVCNEMAPTIARQLSEETGWDIYRTSLKPRARKPDIWETAMLTSFEQRHADGDKFKTLFAQDIEIVNGKASFRFMQAIKTQEVCLICHGENIAVDLSTKITQMYPEDSASGFKLGDIRGAFSIVQPLD